MRLALVIHAMSAGGAERVMQTLSTAWAELGWELNLITLAGQEEDFYPLHPSVERVALGLYADSGGSVVKALANNLDRVKALRAALKAARPQAVISFNDMTNVLAIAAGRGVAPVIACEHTDPFAHQIGPLWRRLRRLAYPRAAAVVGVTGAVAEYVRPFMGETPVEVIPNPIVAPEPEDLARGGRTWPPGPTVIGMGRLGPEKGFDLLIKAFASCLGSHPDWRLVILGEGPERPRLEGLAAELGVRDRVHLPGRVGEPLPLLAAADIYCLSSRYEGFPMGLLEALACGLPAVAVDCSTGVREILDSRSGGVVVPAGSLPALAGGLAGLMASPERRAALAAAAPQVTRRFGLGPILARWDDLFARLGLGEEAP